MKSAVIKFLGSNCDEDAFQALKIMNLKPIYLWYQDTIIDPQIRLIIIPGGFSYGDYLRCGAIAAKAPIIKSLIDYINKGGYVLGICNGFQILTETNLLPGALVHNKMKNFICKDVELLVENNNSIFTKHFAHKQSITIPVAHHDGRYYCSDEQLKEIQDNDQIILKYQKNINGSVDNIAAIISRNGKVMGMMPHPERACDDIHSSQDGQNFFLGGLSEFLK